MNKAEETVQWMLEGPAWIRYNLLVKLLGKSSEDPQAKAAYKEMLDDPKIKSLLDDTQVWEISVLKRHNDANHPIHKLSFLAEIGISQEEPRIQSAIKNILIHKSGEGPFQVLSNYPTNFGGSGKDEWLWCLCDAPLILYSLLKLGFSKNNQVLNAALVLNSLARENGWPCAATKALGDFRGPGKKTDPCPYANLLMLKMAAELEDASIINNTRYGIETILGLWEHSHDSKPFLFKMGTDFRKLKVPFVWYDILHVLDVLSKYPETYKDPRFQSMLEVVLSKASPEFRFSSESIWMKWEGWEFRQKREPSMWITFSVLQILKRVGKLEFKNQFV